MADGDTDASFRCVASRRTPAFVVEGTECTAFVSSVNVHRDVAAGWCRAWPSARVESGRASPSCFIRSGRRVPRDLVGPAGTLRGFDSRRLHSRSKSGSTPNVVTDLSLATAHCPVVVRSKEWAQHGREVSNQVAPHRPSRGSRSRSTSARTRARPRSCHRRVRSARVRPSGRGSGMQEALGCYSHDAGQWFSGAVAMGVAPALASPPCCMTQLSLSG
jgi:hypothetical protein